MVKLKKYLTADGYEIVGFTILASLFVQTHAKQR